MSQKIDPREVLTYLNELGYTNINAQQLKEFITDLKKLIKYEYKHRKEYMEHSNSIPGYENNDSNESRCCGKPHCPNNQLNTDSNKLNKCKHSKENIKPVNPSYSNHSSNYDDQCCNEPLHPNNQQDTSENKQDNNNVFDYLHNQHTVSSRAKEIPKRERHISVHITKAKSRNQMHDHCVHIEEGSEIVKNGQESDLQLVTKIGSTNSGSQLVVETNSSIRSIRPCSKSSLVGKSSSSKVAKSKSTLIKPRYSKPINKCDPVALYHHYQEEWKKQKFPGQENHLDLRWAVREKLLRGPKVDRPRVGSSGQSRCNSWKI